MNMEPEGIICIVGAVIAIYFGCRPQPEKKPKDKLTKELHLRGMPPQYPFDGGAMDLNNPDF